MFGTFKKLLTTPLPLGILIFILAILLLHKNAYGKAKMAMVFGVLWFFVFSYEPLTNWMLHHLEIQYPTLKHVPKQTSYIYILGGGHHTDSRLPITSQIFPEAQVRLIEGLRLYRESEGKAKLILSGHNSSKDATSHAEMQKKLAVSLGINPKDIILATTPTNTREEAQMAKKIAKDKLVILVTSAYHMPRAYNWFKQYNVNVIAAPTYHQAYVNHPDYSKILTAYALNQSTIVFHELLGILWQKIKRN